MQQGRKADECTRIGGAPMNLKFEDWELVDVATDLIKERYLYSKHTIGAAVRMQTGAVFLGVNLNTYAGHLAVCAESVAMGAAAVLGYGNTIDTIVAVRHPPPEDQNQKPAVVAPCGACRERIFDYGPHARVILLIGDSLKTVPIGDLLPNKYQRPL